MACWLLAERRDAELGGQRIDYASLTDDDGDGDGDRDSDGDSEDRDIDQQEEDGQ